MRGHGGATAVAEPTVESTFCTTLLARAEADVRTALARLEQVMATTSPHTPPAIAALKAAERVSAIVEARRFQAVVEAAGSEPEYLNHRTPAGRDGRISDIRAVELAAHLGCSPDRARNMAHRARVICGELPDVLDHLDRGVISGYFAVLAADGWRDLTRRWDAADSTMPDGLAKRFQHRILHQVAVRTAAEFRRRVMQAVAMMAPHDVQAAHRAAADERCVTLTPAGDGMAWLSAYLEAAAAAQVMQVLDHAARNDTTLTGTRDQRAADALVSIVTGAAELSPASRSAAAEVQLLVSAEALAEGRLVGQIEGSGALIEGEALLRLMADAKFRRLLIDGNGRLLDFGRTTYRPPTALADHVTARDRSCRAPGCSRPARYADLDHIEPWEAGGTTAADNLAALCRTHHVLKTHGSWQYSVGADGAARWRLPGDAQLSRAPADYTEHMADNPPPF